MQVQYSYGPGGKRYDSLGHETTIGAPIYHRTMPWDEQSPPTQSENCQKLARWENLSRDSYFLNVIKENRDWRKAFEVFKSSNSKIPDEELRRELYNTTLLFAVKEAIKKENFDVAWDIACFFGGKMDEDGRKGFLAACLAAERGYEDVYFFLIEKIENPRSFGSIGDSLMDWLDQGIEEYGINPCYQSIKQDLTRRGVQLHLRKQEGGCCLMI